MQSNNEKAFLALVKAGLWEDEVHLSQYGDIDFSEVYRLAEEQSVVGLVAAGLEHVIDVKVPQEIALQFVGQALQLEQRNKAMNDFIGVIVKKLSSLGVYTLLVKGQGVAQCYERPLWRACGDIDLFLTLPNYNIAKRYLEPLASSSREESNEALHWSAKLELWEIELHGTLRSFCLPRMDLMVDEVQDETFTKGVVRVWKNIDTEVLLPNVDNDIIFIFTHILKHFFHGGIGIRQICDWCRLLWTYRDSINRDLLEKRLKRGGITTEWKVFAAFAINYLGMPDYAMPLYSNKGIWSRKAERINRYLIYMGNFGHNRIAQSNKNISFIIRKISSFFKYTLDGIRQFFIFPLDSITVWMWVIKVGISTAKNKIC